MWYVLPFQHVNRRDWFHVVFFLAATEVPIEDGFYYL